MSTLVGRHGLSAANDKRLPAYGEPDAPLLLEGRQQSQVMGIEFCTKFGDDILAEEVAVTELLRSQETAQYAGFTALTVAPGLNEISKAEITLQEIWHTKQTGQAPAIAIERAELILRDPPPQKIWITHGLIILGLCEVLGVSGQYKPIAQFCEIRELTI